MTIRTVVVWGRGHSPAELTTVSNQIATLVASGVTDGVLDLVGDTAYRTWTTSDAANAWLTFLNTFSPAPSSATVETV